MSDPKFYRTLSVIKKMLNESGKRVDKCDKTDNVTWMTNYDFSKVLMKGGGGRLTTQTSYISRTRTNNFQEANIKNLRKLTFKKLPGSEHLKNYRKR
jgi:hypothetical protein